MGLLVSRFYVSGARVQTHPRRKNMAEHPSAPGTKTFRLQMKTYSVEMASLGNVKSQVAVSERITSSLAFSQENNSLTLG